MFTPEERKELIRVAREAVKARTHGKPEEAIEEITAAGSATPRLLQHGGAFVTLYKSGELRGCLGYIESSHSLKKTVAETAWKVAADDFRFYPVAEDELADIRVEISALSPLQKISDVEEIQIGKHGLLIEAGTYRGLLLPQVAEKYHWDRIQFLEETCVKAGVPRDTWKKPAAHVFIFSAEIIEETSE
ncbi:MAG: AmmeMemoRadiSam system protein A [Bacteroidota bacterium]|nr:AmmeMemoRadiSam system protein A [Bacteroidota bacterium]